MLNPQPTTCNPLPSDHFLMENCHPECASRYAQPRESLEIVTESIFHSHSINPPPKNAHSLDILLRIQMCIIHDPWRIIPFSIDNLQGNLFLLIRIPPWCSFFCEGFVVHQFGDFFPSILNLRLFYFLTPFFLGNKSSLK